MGFWMWFLLALRILRGLLPLILGVLSSLLVMSMVGPIPPWMTLPAFVFVVAVMTGVIGRDILGRGGPRPDNRGRS